MKASEPPRAHGQLSVELERLTLRAIVDEHRHLNGSLFGWRLSTPRFQLTDSEVRLGCWHGASRTLDISRHLVLDHEWGSLVEVLKHEMAHQYVDEVLSAGTEAAHGPAFQRVCAARGIDARASGLPSAPADDGAASRHPALGKIAHLLRLASSANENEAQSAMNAAQRLMLRYNLEEAESAVVADHCFRHVGVPTGRVFEPARILALILAEHFFVEAIWVSVWRPRQGKRGSVLEICGKRANVEIAHYAHDFLTSTAERLWRQHKRLHRIAANRDRRSFLAGVMAGFRAKLDAQTRQHRQEGLVWKGDPEVAAYFKARHPRSRWARYCSSHDEAAHAAGREAGRQIVLHRGVTEGSSRGKRRALLSG